MIQRTKNSDISKYILKCGINEQNSDNSLALWKQKSRIPLEKKIGNHK